MGTFQIERLTARLQQLGKIGYQVGKGTSRMAYSQAFAEGRACVKKWMEEAGLSTWIDPVGNLTGRLQGGGKVISIGSHIDTVPNGGMYDGALGVLSAIECLQVLREEGYANCHTIEVIAFNEEEGNVIGGTFGSRSFTGASMGEKEMAAMPEYGISPDDVKASKRREEDYRCYIELHIEQGGRLEYEKKQIGIVDGIVGIMRFRAAVMGQSNHAGSTPMHLRKDAMVKSCEIIQKLNELVHRKNNTMVCTVGEFRIVNPAVNVIPGETQFLIEMRDTRTSAIREVIEELRSLYPEEELQLVQFLEQKESYLNTKLGDAAEEICRELGMMSMHMFSGAGHDAINMTMFTPSSMIFIPSVDGISHSIREFTKPEDLENGGKLLYHLLKKLDRQEMRGELYED